MKPGSGEVLVVLNRHLEIGAVEAGILSAGLIDDPLEQQVFNSTRQLREGSFGYDRIEHPTLEVTRENTEPIRASLNATVALGGLEGLRATFHRQKRIARKLLQVISHY